jgi:hypothetical protein
MGGEVLLNEKFRENPPPLSNPSRDAPAVDTPSSPLSTGRSNTITPSSHDVASIEAAAEKNEREDTLPPPLHRREFIPGLRRRHFFLALYITSGLLALSIIISLVAYLTRPKPSPCDSQYSWSDVTTISTPERDYSYLGCYLSATAGGINPPVVQNGPN